MLNLLFMLITIFTIHSAVAMEPDQKHSHKTIVLEPLEWEPSQRNWSLELTLLDFDEPITDERLLELNPAWRQIKDHCSIETKKQIYSELENGVFALPTRTAYLIERTLRALMTYCGWNPNDRRIGNWPRILEIATGEHDYHFVKYLLFKGAWPENDNPNGETALQLAAMQSGEGDASICRLIINHYIDQHQAFLSFLWYIKKSFPDFYRHKDVLRFCFKELSPMRRLYYLFSYQGCHGTAFQICKLTARDLLLTDELDPETCTYQKFMNLRKGAQI